jgi:polyferredoxin
MNELSTERKKSLWLLLLVAAIVFLLPGIVMLNYPEFFVDGLWNSLNLMRIMGGVFLLIFTAIAVFTGLVALKNLF